MLTIILQYFFLNKDQHVVLLILKTHVMYCLRADIVQYLYDCTTKQINCSQYCLIYQSDCDITRMLPISVLLSSKRLNILNVEQILQEIQATKVLAEQNTHHTHMHMHVLCAHACILYMHLCTHLCNLQGETEILFTNQS